MTFIIEGSPLEGDTFTSAITNFSNPELKPISSCWISCHGELVAITGQTQDRNSKFRNL